MICNRAQLADIFGVSPQAIGQWTDDGMPCLERGGSGVESAYDTAAAIAWRLERAAASAPGAADRARLVKVQADRAELELMLRLGELTRVDEVKAALFALGREAGEAFLGFPAQLAGVLAGLSPEQIQTALEAEIAKRLAALADRLDRQAEDYERRRAAAPDAKATA